MTKIYFEIKESEFNKVNGRLRQQSIDIDPNDKDRKEMLLLDSSFEEDEIYLEDNEDIIYLNGILNVFGIELGYISLEIPLNQELAIDIVDRYVKKLQKLKTVLEATK